MNTRYKFLVLGPLRKQHEPEGGLTVSFGIFLEQLKKNNIDFEVINSNKVSYKYKSIALLKIYWLFFKKVQKSSHISMHGSNNDFIYLAPLVVFFSRILNKTVSLRKFAGDFDEEEFEKLTTYKKKFAIYALSNSNINFFQTKYLIKYFKQYNDNTFWFPTIRNKPIADIPDEKVYKKRFIFLGHIRPEKGIDQILEVSKLLDDSYHIDLYGSISDDKYHDIDWKEYTNITYNGALESSNVYAKLSEHDVLLLPTYWIGEGYPGVIIEAFSLGIPVVATNLSGISEIVNEASGILIEMKNIEQLKNAIYSFNNNNYKYFSKAALGNFTQFDAEIKIKEIIGQIKAIM